MVHTADTKEQLDNDTEGYIIKCFVLGYPYTNDSSFYEFPLCSNTIVSTCAVLGKRSTPCALTG